MRGIDWLVVFIFVFHPLKLLFRRPSRFRRVKKPYIGNSPHPEPLSTLLTPPAAAPLLFVALFRLPAFFAAGVAIVGTYPAIGYLRSLLGPSSHPNPLLSPPIRSPLHPDTRNLRRPPHAREAARVFGVLRRQANDDSGSAVALLGVESD